MKETKDLFCRHRPRHRADGTQHMTGKGPHEDQKERREMTQKVWAAALMSKAVLSVWVMHNPLTLGTTPPG